MRRRRPHRFHGWLPARNDVKPLPPAEFVHGQDVEVPVEHYEGALAQQGP